MNHDFHDYMSQVSIKMEAEYTRIRKTASLDPGTAGDEGEENWAELLRDWLPSAYRVVTKGQILDSNGELSPQVDILVLKPSYPSALHSKKKYLAAGIAAAFECKLTLRKAHIEKSVRTCAIVKRMGQRKKGSPYKELLSGPIFGILSHSHSWCSDNDKNSSTIADHLFEADKKHVAHPREMIDLLCVSDLATWSSTKSPLCDPSELLDPDDHVTHDPSGVPATAYMCHSNGSILNAPSLLKYKVKRPPYSPIGILLSELLSKLAWEDKSIRPIAAYFHGLDFCNSAYGKPRAWTRKIYSKKLNRKLTLDKLDFRISWNKWATSIE